jgi:AcrR family transcriptional regulator
MRTKPEAKRAKRDPVKTRNRILKAAHTEFTDVGLAGARVDRIADAAGVNKRMLYHYFKNKEGLFREMMRRSLAELSQADVGAPRDLGDELIYWRELLRTNPDWIRLLLWEALSYKQNNIIGGKERQAFWQSGVQKIERDQLASHLAADLDSGLLQLYLFAFAAIPFLVPQMTELITGNPPTNARFLKRHDDFLRQFGRLLSNQKVLNAT